MFNDQEKELIKELNLESFSEEEQTKQLASFFRTLNMKVSMAVEDTLKESQLREFAEISDKGNDDSTMEWLKTAVPDYDQIVVNQTELLKKDIQQSGEDYLAVLNKVIDK